MDYVDPVAVLSDVLCGIDAAVLHPAGVGFGIEVTIQVAEHDVILILVTDLCELKVVVVVEQAHAVLLRLVADFCEELLCLLPRGIAGEL